MKDEQIDLCGQVGCTQTAEFPPLEKQDVFQFACRGCGDCCRGREDIVLSGYDLWRICNRLRLPPALVVRSFCRHSIGTNSQMPVVRLQPLKNEKNNCPFLYKSRCAIHDAKPLVCALYPLGQQIDTDGTISYFMQPTDCGGQVIRAKVTDYLALYKIEQREPLDIDWALTCMELAERVQALEQKADPIQIKLLGRKIYRALYLDYNWEQDFAPQFAANKKALFAVLAELEGKSV